MTLAKTKRWMQAAVLCAPIFLTGSLCDMEGARDIMGSSPPDPEKYDPQNYSVNLTQAAQQRELPPVFGRTRDLRRLLQATGSRNVVLIGPPGVGKTSLMGHLAKHSPRTVWQIDLSKLVALLGSKAEIVDTQQWIHFIKRAVELHRAAGDNPIIFVDEIQTIFQGFGGSRSAPDALKTFLDQHKGIVLATTSEEFGLVFPRTARGLPLLRRLQQIRLREPTHNHAFSILKQAVASDPSRYGASVSEDRIRESVRLATLFLHRVAAPGSTLGLLQQAAKRAALQGESRVARSDLVAEAAGLAKLTVWEVQQLVDQGALALDTGFYDAVTLDKDKINEKLLLGEVDKREVAPEQNSLVAPPRQSQLFGIGGSEGWGQTRATGGQDSFSRLIGQLEEAVRQGIKQGTYTSVFEEQR